MKKQTQYKHAGYLTEKSLNNIKQQLYKRGKLQPKK
tara:strand:- start:245 stop:352 length:108 start_codon:yes stop_codon:yes gene_type:complete